ncbi:hypothetical protein DSC91_006245 [Paraburkholderia caffeinilytica]|uniref:Lipoprotein n=2 Tax=Paraburkholderia caffeinilytica TaxID=1761016 RepID=A0ABQ1N120_9BURK|nr:hypothetical protein DSC91_006245 [Paraburkholderia caffeinilytica]GGC50536.1 lipoprotein [Paraburkholderia caffeinilytica]CAB3788675.1 hypothetical protein LMG28690_02705 [Paraburkholderia caffeinilytica]
MKALSRPPLRNEDTPSELSLVDGARTALIPRMPAAERSGNRLRLVLAGALCVGASLLTSGCSSVGAASGAAAGVASGLVTSNPAVGIGVGIAVQAATDEAVGRYMRIMHTDQQNMIAALAGAMPVGETRPWAVKHTLPIENGHGQVRVTRAFSSALALCKEFVFSVQDGDGPNAHEDWYTASACRQDKGWKWASAEPAVERWGALQ